MERITGVIIQYDAETGLGIVKDADCAEHVFNYTGYLAPDLERGQAVMIVRDAEYNDTVYVA